ncbi:MAG: DUF4167 domain-containing protein [Hyphomicrobiaceae bacterium]|nr:MAG: DUF4167 domain-containing protein [Hyphomicrobiaceae bacterium]
MGDTPLNSTKNGRNAHRGGAARTFAGPRRPTAGPPRHRGGGSGTVNAQRSYERYLALARAAASSGDKIEAENYYQHAEHFFRQMKSETAQ